MDLVRDILLAIERQQDGWAPETIEVPEYSEEQIGYHVLIMIEGGLVNGQDVTTMGASPTGSAARLTWQGHEFLDAARESKRWGVTKKIPAKLDGAPLKVFAYVLTKLATDAIDALWRDGGQQVGS